MRSVTTFLLAAVVGLVALSLIMLASATMLDRETEIGIRNQLIATLIGFTGLGIAATLDYRRITRLSWVAYGVSIVLLILVLSPLGHEAKGAKRWIFGIQPSELAKASLVLALAAYGAARQPFIQQFWKGLMMGCLVAFPLLVLVALEPDRGTTALLLLVTLLMLLLAGVRWWFVLPPAAAGVAAIATMIAVSPMARARIDAWLNPDAHRDEGALQVRRALQAFAVGRIEGQGLAAGAQKFRVPEVHTDFILPAVGEDLGILGSLGVLLAYLTILCCGFWIAHRAADLHGLLLAGGITFLIATQATVNIGVVTAMLPNKGMPLPFVSRGGSSVAVLLTLIGVLLSVARQAGVVEQAEAALRQSGRDRSRNRSRPSQRNNPFSNPDFAPLD